MPLRKRGWSCCNSTCRILTGIYCTLEVKHGWPCGPLSDRLSMMEITTKVIDFHSMNGHEAH